MHLDDLEILARVSISEEKEELIANNDGEPQSEISHILSEYILDRSQYEKVSSLLLDEMEHGLSKEHNVSAAVKMFPTYVRSLPDGSERGDFLALDLGGTNFRVLAITLNGLKVEMKNKIYPIAPEIMTGKATQLFDHIASCIDNFMAENGLSGQKLPLGFTFSFPCKQEGLAVGRLVRWTKGFKCEGVEGEDVVTMLHEAIKRKGLGVECVALINDTVGCLMSCAFHDHNTQVGVILGTGTNACYMEHLDRVGTWDDDTEEPKQVIINTEWGAFGDNGCLDFIRTKVDRDIDATSLNPGKQLYEKMISGMYMGEIVRMIAVECAEKGLLFNGQVTPELAQRERFYTKFVSEIEEDNNEEEGYPKVRQVLDELGLVNVTTEDCRILKHICSVVSTRAAYLASTELTVAVDGSLYRFHPHFHDLMFCMRLSEDGSGKGAALVAAVANRLRSRSAQLVFVFKLMLSEDGSGKGAALVAAVAYRMKLMSPH
ncbi:hypothetical protein LSH36_406g01045 [Paralvinella palmiformis]|uniref:Phosphotransferase n=1 Tax=Paralvinella palmiformis TaxID=53620 RepID=A0AAD9JCE8_9ANNE|nr:hypothetical protein LSH36_406g01045 [Paralvinella palmiformis]